MSDLLALGSSGLRAYQTALDVVGENISNANVAGYSRRQAVITENAAGSGYPLERQVYGGMGSYVSSIARSYDSFLTADARSAGGDYARVSTRQQWLTQIQSFLNNNSQGLGGQLTAFYNAAQDLATDPTSTSARDAFLSSAGNIADQFRGLAASFDSARKGIEADAQTVVKQINDTANALAKINDGLRRSAAGSSQAASLQDERDRLLDQLGMLTKIDVAARADGTVDVRLDNSNGPMLLDQQGPKLLGVSASGGKLQLTLDPFGQSGAIPMPGSGALAGLSDAYTQLQDSASSIDQLAEDFANTINQQHRQGADLNGQAGGDLFTTTSLTATPSRTNVGQATLQLQVIDRTQLSSVGYELRYNGATSQWTLARKDGSASVTGAGPLDLDGMHIDLGGAPRDGDWFSLAGVTGAAGMQVTITDPAKVAAASPWTGDAVQTNQGNATIAVRVNASSTAVPPLSSYEVRIGAAGAYDIVDPATNTVLASGTVTSGGWISGAGFDFQLNGTPQAGDSFTLQATPAGAASNGNMLSLIATRQGGASFESGYSRAVTRVATNLSDSIALATANKNVLDKANAARDAASGVNLDEEAADLIRFQQAYQASAKIIAAAREIFQTIIDIR